MALSKNLLVGLGAFAAVAVIGSGIGVATAANTNESATASASPTAAANQDPPATTGEAPAEAGDAPTEGMRAPEGGSDESHPDQGPGGGAGFLAEELASTLGLDTEVVAAALEEAEAELADAEGAQAGRGPLDPSSLAPVLAEKLSVSEDDVAAALEDLQPPAMGGHDEAPPNQEDTES